MNIPVMNRTKSFGRSWLLCAWLGAAWTFAASAGTNEVPRLGVEEFAKKVADQHNLVLDVRTPKEFAAGHIPGAVNQDVLADGFKGAVEKLERSRTYLVHCASGRRSQQACQQMQALGFTNLFELRDGFVGWQKAGKPVEKPRQ